MNNFSYKQIDVWKKIDESCVIRFICFENIEKKMFCVQSADYFYNPIDEKQLYNSNKQLVELFIEEVPDSRSKLFATIEEAISEHLESFT